MRVGRQRLSSADPPSVPAPGGVSVRVNVADPELGMGTPSSGRSSESNGGLSQKARFQDGVWSACAANPGAGRPDPRVLTRRRR